MKTPLITILLMSLILLTACLPKPRIPQAQTVTFGTGSDKVVLDKISERVWAHVTEFEWNGYLVPSNGLVVITDDGAVLFDTPWTEGQTASLVDGLSREFRCRTILAVITHAHQDRIGGIAELHRRKIETTGTALTATIAGELGYESPKVILPDGGAIRMAGGIILEIRFPGAGHTADNLVVWLPGEKILFGGCLVKELAARTPGNTADADLGAWGDSLLKLKEWYPDMKIVVPGHGAWGGPELIDHTRELVTGSS